MGFLDKYTGDRFRVLTDGRTIFLPKGDGGPIYLVPDEATRKRYERLIQVGGWIASFSLVIAGKFAFRDGTFNWQWAALLLLIPAWAWHINRQAAEHLQEVHDASLFEAPSIKSTEYKGAFVWARAAGAIAVLIAGLIYSIQSPVAWVRWVSLAAAFIAALTLPFTINDLQRKRELDRRERERLDAWLNNSASSRRRF